MNPIEKQKENLEKLFQLIKENPELPIVPMVEADVVCEDYGRWMGSIGEVRIDHYLMVDDGFWFYSEKYSGALAYFSEEAYENLPWIKAIIVNIDLPETDMI